MEMRLSNIFKIKNVKNLNIVILESCCRVLQVTFKWKILKQLFYILRAVEFRPTFDIEIDINLPIFWENLQNHTF